MRKNRSILILVIVATIILATVIGLYLVNQSGDIVNPNEDELIEGDAAGVSYAVIYSSSELYSFLNQNDDTYRLIEEDLSRFVQITNPSFTDPDTLYGFTITKSAINGDTAEFEGKFYALNDNIKLEVQKFSGGKISLSVTNQSTGENVDEQLNLGGKKNEVIISLPIEEDNYSIRYLNSEDKIVVSFLPGYSREEAVKTKTILQNLFEGQYPESEVLLAINGIGTFSSIEEIISFADDPDNKPFER